jgi:hypothetical protein
MEREAELVAQSRREQETRTCVATTTSSAATSSSKQGAQSANCSIAESDGRSVKSTQSADAARLQLINGGSMLVPTPITSSAVASRGSEQRAVGARGIVDLKDFESEQDPFENLSLRVMNDREELNKVFRMAATLSPAEAPAASPVASSVLAGKNNETENAVEGRSSALLQYVSGGASDSALTSGISFVPCQLVSNQTSDRMSVPLSGVLENRVGCPIPQNPTSIRSLPEPTSNVGHLPSNIGFLNNGDVSYAVSGFPPPAVSTVSCIPLRTTKSTPDITSLDDKSAVNLARRTPPPVKPTALKNSEVNTS